ncbi:hydroxymethylglutaryl-CoA lyase [Alloalcanivorax profundimaris]|uniref:hydroxymethylglutaryl-CoA lyase n=1 Tax=Alloalcanivorax profundimaris TaxID=2735259 RepID=UPI0018891C30|nr:hydroxymethylglutaryl-CoA lyase [Alloalcanivorax profundimaris]MBF1803383.1 hydroxymethylglutaryl-CoA lyase [Alloalcanivorax profundimaris]
MSPTAVRLVEVGARDGLQNEARTLPPEARAELIRRLAAAGLRHIEAGAFVSPRWVPQMAGTDAVLAALPAGDDLTLSVLVPNERGMAMAIESGCQEVAVFTAASEAFNRRNINCSIEESLARFEPVMAMAKEKGIAVRGYVSCVLGCPYDGPIPVADVVATASRLYQMGCYEISLGDTIGAGVPSAVRDLVAACAMAMPVARLAAHFHDTWGMAVANCVAALEGGIRVFDSSVSGLGGCPYSPGATGNVATEDLIYLFEGMGLDTGADLEGVIHAGDFADRQLGRETASRVARAWRARQAAG